MLETGLIPPTVNIHTPNPAIRWGKYGMRVPTEVTPLPEKMRLISIASSGIGGSNGHALIQGVFSRGIVSRRDSSIPVLLVAGGLSPRTAGVISEDLRRLCEKEPKSLHDISAVYGRRARGHTWRSYGIYDPTQGHEIVDFSEPRLAKRNKLPVVFVFSGQGPQHTHSKFFPPPLLQGPKSHTVGRQLFKAYPVFQKSILEMDEVYERITGKSLVRDVGLFDEERENLLGIWPISIIQPALAIIHMALYDLLIWMGVKPDIVLGHSAGESAMLYASGAVPREMSVEIAIARGRAMTIVEEIGGGMAAVGCSPTEARQLIDAASRSLRSDDVLEIACFNAHDAIALAGTDAMIEKAVELAQMQKMFARKIKTRVAGHSALMDSCHKLYQQHMDDIFSRYGGNYFPTLPVFSTQTGNRHNAAFTAQYMWTNARDPVLFEATIKNVLQSHPDSIFVEITPHPVLSSYISSAGAKTDQVICPMQRRRNPHTFDEVRDILQSLGQLVSLGYDDVDFILLNSTNPDSMHSVKAELPTYPFVRKHVPYLAESSAIYSRQMRSRNGPLNYNGQDIPMNRLTHPDLAQHVINGEPVLPGTGFMEMVS